MKVVINKCYGGFSLSKAAVLWLAKKGHASAKKEVSEKKALVKKYGSKPYRFKAEDPDHWDKNAASDWARGDTRELMGYSWRPWEEDKLPRHHPLLVQCVETLGDKAGGGCAALCVAEIPDNVDYEIQEYDGQEWIAERHRTWG